MKCHTCREEISDPEEYYYNGPPKIKQCLSCLYTDEADRTLANNKDEGRPLNTPATHPQH